MNRQLSRQAARIMHTEVILGLPLDDSMAFVKAVAEATSFDELSKKWQTIITNAEKSLYKSLVELCREAKGDFVWDWGGEQIIIKGKIEPAEVE